MKGYIDGDLGRISIDSEVIARYAGSTAVECFGIVGMAAVSMKDGLFKLLKGDSLTRGINVKIDEDNKIFSLSNLTEVLTDERKEYELKVEITNPIINPITNLKKFITTPLSGF